MEPLEDYLWTPYYSLELAGKGSYDETHPAQN